MRNLHTRALTSLLLIAIAFFLPISALAQTSVATPVPAAQEAASPTATATRTPAPTPTPTPTLTALQARLVLAETFLKGGDYAKAAELFAAIAVEDRGNPQALKGLQEALDKQATARAPAPTAVATKPAATPVPTFGQSFSREWNNLTSVVLAGLILLFLVYLLAGLVRRALIWGREALLVDLPTRLGLKPILPPIYIGEITDSTGIRSSKPAEIVAQALATTLVHDSQTAFSKWENVSVQPAPDLPLGAMAWIKVLWNWLIPPRRGYKISCVLSAEPARGYQLAAQRLALATDRVDASYLFSDPGTSPREAFERLGIHLARWARNPAGYEAILEDQKPRKSPVPGRGPRMMAPTAVGPGAGAVSSAQVLDDILEILRNVSQTKAQRGAAAARNDLMQAYQLAKDELPEGSSLREDIVADIEKQLRRLPGGP